jgi:hypothetical protein
MNRRTQNRSQSRNRYDSRCTCSARSAPTGRTEKHVTFSNPLETQPTSERNRSRSRGRRNKSNDSSMDSGMYDASGEDSMFDALQKKRTNYREGYDASYEDSVFDPSFQSTMMEDSFNNFAQNQASMDSLPDSSASSYRGRNMRRKSMSDFENSHRRELHELLDDESVNESLLDLEDDLPSVPHLGYIYRVNSFR